MAIDGGAPVSAELARFDALIERYPNYLRGQRGLSENTVRIYLDDFGSFRRYLCLEEATLEEMDRSMLRGYMAWVATDALGGKGYARVSIADMLRARARPAIADASSPITPGHSLSQD